MRLHSISVNTLCLMLLTGNTLPAQELLNPLTQPQFVNPLPIPAIVYARSGGAFTFNITQFNQHLGLVHPQTGQPMVTQSVGLWGLLSRPYHTGQKRCTCKHYLEQ